MKCSKKIIKDKYSNKETIIQAIGLKTGFAKFDFISTWKICVITCILEVLAPEITWLQGILIGFGPATKIIDDTDNELKKLRTD